MNDFSLAERFEENRGKLRSVAYRMLGSTSEADDAVQEAWLRLSRSDTSEVENLAAWLTTVVGRVCLDMLRSRKSRGEEPLGVHVPDPIVSLDPEQETLMADSVGLALLVVLEALSPAERLSFVLHDMFGVPFDDIAGRTPAATRIAGRSPAATRQLASRARRRVQGVPAPETDLTRQRTVVEAFIAASRSSPLRAVAISTRSSRCSIRTSCCTSTGARSRSSCAALPRSRVRRSCSRGLRRIHGLRSSTAPGAFSPRPKESPRRSWPSRCATGWWPSCTFWPTLSGSNG